MYDLKDLAVMTGLTVRTLMNCLNLGLLKGEKNGGKWIFSEEQVTEFVENPNVRQALTQRARRYAMIF